MRGILSLLAVAALLCGSCVRQGGDTTLYQISGRQKPIVAVMPVINHVDGPELKWDLSRELTDEIRRRVYESKRIYLLREGGNMEIAKALSTPNPKLIPETALSNLGATEFAVVAEIIEQEEVPYGTVRSLDDDPAGAVLSLALRVRVIDIRHDSPKVILQEVLDQDFVISRAYIKSNYEKARWGTEAYNRTPMGMAHQRMVRELVARIEAYIEASL